MHKDENNEMTISEINFNLLAAEKAAHFELLS